MANRILIVEDDSSIAETIALNLKYVGYEYMVFDDGVEAVEYLAADHSFDLALLDIMLPGLDGKSIRKGKTMIQFKKVIGEECDTK